MNLLAKTSLISIIVPVYNAQKYVARCIASILNQSYCNIELIFVNDCSTDQSLKVAERYRCKDDRLKIINKPVNEHVEKARLDGISLANGEYIAFVDADDFLPQDAISQRLLTIEKDDADIAIGLTQKVFDKFEIFKKKPDEFPSEAHYYKDRIKTEVAAKLLNGEILYGSLCGKLYKQSLFKDNYITPSGLSWQEDAILNLKILPKVDKIAFVNEVVYSYRYGGSTSRFNPRFIENIPVLLRHKLNFSNEYGINLGVTIYVEAYKLLLAHLKNFVRFKAREKNQFLLLCQTIKSDERFDLLTNKNIYLEVKRSHLLPYDNNVVNVYYSLFINDQFESLHGIYTKEYKRDYFKNSVKKLYTSLVV